MGEPIKITITATAERWSEQERWGDFASMIRTALWGLELDHIKITKDKPWPRWKGETK